MDTYWTCVAMMDMEAEDLGFKIMGLPPDQVFVREVEPNGWAAKNGVWNRDELVGLNDLNIFNMTSDQFNELFFSRPVAITFRRPPASETTAFYVFPLPPLGARVTLRHGKALKLHGTVRFTGLVHFAEGNVVGVELDTRDGDCDGSVAGERYFACRSKYGRFTIPECLQVLDVPQLSSYAHSRKERRNLLEYKGDLPRLGVPVLVDFGHRQLHGRVRFAGKAHFSPDPVVGVELETRDGNCDGCVQDRQYFECRPLYGLFCSPEHLQVITTEKHEQSVATQFKYTIDETKARRRIAAEQRLEGAMFEGDNVRLCDAIKNADELGVAHSKVWSACKEARRLNEPGRVLAHASGGESQKWELDLLARDEFAGETVDVLESSDDDDLGCNLGKLEQLAAVTRAANARRHNNWR